MKYKMKSKKAIRYAKELGIFIELNDTLVCTIRQIL